MNNQNNKSLLLENEKLDVYLCVTIYHLLLSMLMINYRKKKEKSILLLFANNGKVFECFKKNVPLLEKKGYYVEIHLRNKKKDVLGLEKNTFRQIYRKVKRHVRIDLDNNFTLFNYAWNFQYIYSTAEIFYKHSKNVILVEEGVLGAYTAAQPKWKVAIKRIIGANTDFYNDKKLLSILVQKPETYPSEWSKKITKFSIEEIINGLNEKDKNEIIDIILGDYAEAINISNENDIGIIYSQPFSEDGLIDEKQKITDLCRIVKYYEKYGKPIIKLHPRDTTDYKLDDSYIVLPGLFPSEVFLLKNICFLYAVGINTSAVCNTKAKYCITLNENFDNEKTFDLVPLE